MSSKKIHHENDHPSGNQEEEEWKTARYAEGYSSGTPILGRGSAMEIADAGPMDRANLSDIEAKISPVAPVRSSRAEREVVSDSNEKEKEDYDLLYLSKGEMSDFALQSIRSKNSSEAGPGYGRSLGSPAELGKVGQTCLPPLVPEAIAEEKSSTEDTVSSVVRDTTMRSGFAPKKGAATKACQTPLLFQVAKQGHNLTASEVCA